MVLLNKLLICSILVRTRKGYAMKRLGSETTRKGAVMSDS